MITTTRGKNQNKPMTIVIIIIIIIIILVIQIMVMMILIILKKDVFKKNNAKFQQQKLRIKLTELIHFKIHYHLQLDN